MRFVQGDNVRVLTQTLRDDEQVRVLASASDTPLRAGALCLTNERLLFVRHRIIAKSIVISLPISQIEGVDVEERPLSGVLIIASAGSAYKFEITPKMKAWAVMWPIKAALALASEAGR